MDSLPKEVIFIILRNLQFQELLESRVNKRLTRYIETYLKRLFLRISDMGPKIYRFEDILVKFFIFRGGILGYDNLKKLISMEDKILYQIREGLTKNDKLVLDEISKKHNFVIRHGMKISFSIIFKELNMAKILLIFLLILNLCPLIMIIAPFVTFWEYIFACIWFLGLSYLTLVFMFDKLRELTLRWS